MTAVPSNLPAPGKESADAMEPRQRAAQLLAGRQQRVSRIRKGAIGGSLAAFAAAWVVIFSQLVTGHDPALATNQQAVAPANTSTAATSAASDTSPPALDPVTTQQS